MKMSWMMRAGWISATSLVLLSPVAMVKAAESTPVPRVVPAKCESPPPGCFCSDTGATICLLSRNP
ncbi:hypothetical protein A9762_08250 [Pandoraea sp. ISTKB]|nr:hypothetical protein A9762_08250 [Pandoraea sp. ISTKB]